MARPLAADHGDKRAAILAGAARLFAAEGFDRASMNEIAQALGVSKALVYHYYRSKDALLYDIIRGHLVELVKLRFGDIDAPIPRAATCDSVRRRWATSSRSISGYSAK